MTVDSRRAEDFHLGADVRAADGTHVGRLARVIVGQDDFTLRGVVVKESRRFSGHLLAPESTLISDEIVVPIDAIGKVGHDEVSLTIASADVRRLQPYLSYEAAAPDEVGIAQEILTPFGANPGSPGALEIAAKGPGEIEIERGESVMLGHDGDKLGEVEDVLVDDGQLVGAVVTLGRWFKQPVILPRRFLDRSDDSVLFAHLTADDLERLEPFLPAD
jgi:sporulation protein YlmC with PRC-barrel domain